MSASLTPSVHCFRILTWPLLATLALGIAGTGCRAKAVRGGAGTSRPGMDKRALSTALDREDINDLVNDNLSKMYASPFWTNEVQNSPNGQPLMAIWPIQNETSQHMESQLDQFLAAIETSLVNSGTVGVVSRERQSEMAQEVGVMQGAAFNPSTAAKVGRQLGAKYYVTGKVTVTEERLRRRRRVQYTLFLQVLDVETSLIKFQHEAERSKEMR